MGHRRLPMEPCCFGGLRTQPGSHSIPLGVAARAVRRGTYASRAAESHDRFRAPRSPPAFDHHAPDFGQCAPGSTKRAGRSTKAGRAAPGGADSPASNQSSMSVSYWDARKSLGARRARMDYLGA